MGYGLARLRIDVNGVRHSPCPRTGVPGAYDLFGVQMAGDVLLRPWRHAGPVSLYGYTHKED